MIDLLYYDLGAGVEAFSTRRGSNLPYHVIQSHQVHSDRIAIINDRNIRRDELQGIDAMITNLPECAIGARTADCVPILLSDPRKVAVASIHSGWRGTVQQISKKVIQKMVGCYGTIPSDVMAAIGPSIGPDVFEVHKDVYNHFKKAGFPMRRISRRISDEKYLIDLWESNKFVLIKAGVLESNIQILGVCSYTNNDEFYSARYERNNKCGRTINVIKIKK